MTSMYDTDLIKKFSFFSELHEDDLEKIAGISIERNYRKNMILFMEGEPGEAFYYIKSGKVKVFRSYEDGKEHICLLYTSPSPRDRQKSRMPSSA